VILSYRRIGDYLTASYLDKADDFPEIQRGVTKRWYVPRIRHRAENLDDVVRCHRPKRWVLERSASWLNRFRKLIIVGEEGSELSLTHPASLLHRGLSEDSFGIGS